MTLSCILTPVVCREGERAHPAFCREVWRIAHCPLPPQRLWFFKRYHDPRTALKFYQSDHIAVIVFEGTTEDCICKHLPFQFSTNDRERVVISIHNSS